jgi:mono/diheme cytochrome c family protein
MRRPIRIMLVPAALAAITLGAVFGGWAVTTVKDYPEYAVAGTPVTLTWTVRQHGIEPLSGLRGRLEVSTGREHLEVPAAPGKERGQYTATVTLRDTGTVSLAIRHGFGGEQRKLPALRVVPASAAPTPLPDGESGERLFVAKGCVTCHVEVKVGPTLGGKRYDEAWLTGFLANPRPTPNLARGAEPMPNLGLQPREVAALAAYVNGPRLSAQR